MAAENKVQEIIHRLEVGRWVPWIKFTLVAAIVATLFSVVIFDLREWYSFCGLSHPKGMEQAQIGRNLAEGKGFTTQMIRPAALAQFEQNLGSYPPSTSFPDTYHAPLYPAINAAIIKTFNGINGFLQARTGFLHNLSFEPVLNRDIFVYAYDRILAAFSLIFFILSLPLTYLTIRRLFDAKLAVLSIGLVIGCSRFWDIAATGLPQNFMVLLFSIAVYLLVRATQDHQEGKPALLWLLGVAVCFGLLALTHALTLWIFLGALLYVALAFRERRPMILGLMVAIVLLMYTPWMVRNYSVCGDPFGVSYYSGLTAVRGTESEIMRSQTLKFGVTPTNFRAKLQKGIASQFESIYPLLGSIIAAPVFFLALLHGFKRKDASAIRWAIFSMWCFGALGMAVFGFIDAGQKFQANDLHLLFIPMMTAYGLAFIMVLWTRLDIQVVLLRRTFIVLIYGISLLPLLNMLLEKRSRFQWPPYIPPYIAILADWTNPDEIIMSDMPWAVAWYANRPSLWLPSTVEEFIEMNDYQRKLSGKVVALYLTPVSGNQPMLSGIAKGEYKEWAPFILRQVNIKDFPLKAVTPLPIDGECVIYADRERWRTQGE